MGNTSNKQSTDAQNNAYLSTYSQLINMGFAEELSLNAARRFPNDINKAIIFLETNQTNEIIIDKNEPDIQAPKTFYPRGRFMNDICTIAHCEYQHADTIPTKQIEPKLISKDDRQHISKCHKRFYTRLQHKEHDLAIENVLDMISKEFPQYPQFADKFKKYCHENVFQETQKLVHDFINIDAFDKSVIFTQITSEFVIKNDDKQRLCQRIHDVLSQNLSETNF
eukprot:344612_1